MQSSRGETEMCYNRRLQEHSLYCNWPKLLVDRNRGLCKDCGFEFHQSLAGTVRKGFELFKVIFFFPAEMKFTVDVSRGIYRCVSRNVQFFLRRSSTVCILQRNIKNFVIENGMFYINIGYFTTRIITNSEILMLVFFLSDLKNLRITAN